MTSTQDTLWADIQALRGRFAAIDDQLRGGICPRSSTLVVLVSAGLLAVVGMFGMMEPCRAQPAQPAPELVCKSLMIIGADGRLRAFAGSSQLGDFVQVCTPDGKACGYFGAFTATSNPGLLLSGSLGKASVGLAVAQSGALCRVFSAGGQEQLVLGTQADQNGGILTLNAPNGKGVVQLSQGSGGGNVIVKAHDGKPRTWLGPYTKTATGSVVLYNDLEKVLAGLWGSGEQQPGGVLNLRGQNDKNQVIIECAKGTGGRMYLYSPTSVPLLSLMGHPDTGHGHLQLGPNAKAGVDVFVNANGEGQVWGISGANQVTRWLK